MQDAKSPDDIYKTHLAEGGAFTLPTRPPASARCSAAIFSLHTESLMHPGLARRVRSVRLTHAAFFFGVSAGVVNLWDVDMGFSAIDKYSAMPTNFIKAGVLVGTGAWLCARFERADASAHTHTAQRRPRGTADATPPRPLQA